jgi:hypothetical protein
MDFTPKAMTAERVPGWATAIEIKVPLRALGWHPP